MKALSKDKPKKPKIQNISIDQFEQMAIDAAIAAEMPNIELKHIHTSFSKFSNNEGTRTVSFAVHYFLEESNYYGNAITPELAIQTAIDAFLIATGKTRINAQTKIEPTTETEQSVEVQLKDALITVGAKFYNALSQKFADLTKVSHIEALQYINELLKATV